MGNIRKMMQLSNGRQIEKYDGRLLFSTRRLAEGYGGPCIEAYRTTDGITGDVEFVNDEIDVETIDAFAEGNWTKWSNDFTQAVWIKFSSGTGTPPILLTGVRDPDGGLTATQVTFNKGAGTSSSDLSIIQQTLLGPPAGVEQPFTNSIWIRSEIGPVDMYFRGDLDNDFNDVQVTTDWQRISFTEISGSSATQNYFTLGLRGSAGSSNSATVSIWHAQTCNGNVPGIYIPTDNIAPRSSNIAVKTWYDQSTENKNLEATGAVSTYPLIHQSQTYLDGLKFDGVDDMLVSTGNTKIVGNNYTAYSQIKDVAATPLLGRFLSLYGIGTTDSSATSKGSDIMFRIGLNDTVGVRQNGVATNVFPFSDLASETGFLRRQTWMKKGNTVDFRTSNFGTINNNSTGTVSLDVDRISIGGGGVLKTDGTADVNTKYSAMVIKDFYLFQNTSSDLRKYLWQVLGGTI